MTAEANVKRTVHGHNIVGKDFESVNVTDCCNITINLSDCEGVTINLVGSSDFDINIVDCTDYEIKDHCKESEK